MKTVSVISLALALSLGACASSPGPQSPAKAYSENQKLMLTVCLLGGVLAHDIAEDKLAGQSQQQVASLAGQALVQRVYATDFTDAWSFATQYFNDCARGTRTGIKDFAPADQCLQQALIADKALTQRSQGKPKEDTYRLLPQPDDAKARSIVDGVYALPGTPDAGDSVDTWTDCMGLPRAGTKG